MLSRRQFIIGSLAGLGAPAVFFAPASQARSKVAKASSSKGAALSKLRALSREDWPPAVAPTRIDSVDKGCICFSDDTGRLSIVDFRKLTDSGKPRFVSELGGLGRRVLLFSVIATKAYALVMHDTTNGQSELALLTISLSKLTDPKVQAILPLTGMKEVTCFSVSADMVAAGGVSISDEHLVALFSLRPRSENVLLSSFRVELPVVSVALQNRNVAVLSSSSQAGGKSFLTVLDLSNPEDPERHEPLILDGDFQLMQRAKDTVALVGCTKNKSGEMETVTHIASVSGQTPRILSTAKLSSMQTPLSMSLQKDSYVVLGEAGKGRVVDAISFAKGGQLHVESVVQQSEKIGWGPKPTVLLKDKSVYIASGWESVQVYSNLQGSWSKTLSYNIPRMALSGVAWWEDLAVVQGTELQLFDISNLAKPSMLVSAGLNSQVRSMVGAGSFVLCLSKEDLSLRKMNKLTDSIATIPMIGNRLCFDAVKQRAYVINTQDQITKIIPVKVFSNSLEAIPQFTIPSIVIKAASQSGALALATIHEVYLYDVKDSDDQKQLATRKLDKLGLRDLCMTEKLVLATAVDTDSKGFLLVMSRDVKDTKELPLLATLSIPQDGVAVCALGGKCAVVGKNEKGKDVITLIDVSKPTSPTIVSSLPVIDSASAVVIKEQAAIVVGRGIEIVGLG